jgi:hypothetical protein
MRDFIPLAFSTVILCFFSCTGRTPETADLFTGIEPRAAAPVTSFLDRRHEPYTVAIDSGKITLRVLAKRAQLLKEYLTTPVDSLRYRSLVRSAFLSERDSARVHPEPKRSLRKIPVHQKTRPDSLRIGEAFDGVFGDAAWRVYRTREYDIIVEFEGSLKQRAREEQFGLNVLEELTDHRDYLLAEAGTPGAVWRFRWTIGVDRVSFVKESTRITLGGNSPGNKRSAREGLHIDL